jgi:cytochrome P450
MSSTVHSTAAIPELPPIMPRAHWLLGNLPSFKADSLATVCAWARDYGPIVRARFGPVEQYVLTHPDYIRHVLQTNQRNYIKDQYFMRSARLASGPAHDNLFTSDGEKWLALRRTMQPAFHRQRIAPFGALITAETAKLLDSWQQAAAQRQPIHLEAAMMALTMEIIGRAMFSVDLGPDSAALREASIAGAKFIMARIGQVIQLPLWMPLPQHRRLHHAMATIERILDRIYRARLGGETGQNDLLDMLMAARDPETGAPLTRDQLISEMFGIIFAGHETTATTLAWTFYLLAGDPAVQTKLEEEVDRVLAGRAPTADDLEQLVYTRQVIEETMRLYPAAWTTSRQAVAADLIGGYTIPAGATLYINIYGLHHDPGYWQEPERFDPDRFAPDRVEQNIKGALIPFGAGPRRCIGEGLARMEAPLILASVAQQMRLRPVPGQTVIPEAGFILHMRDDIRMEPAPRRA